MEQKPQCAYCGCSNIKCLAKCSTTGLYFCNGKGVTTKSHILHHLQKIQSDEIELPEGNPFASASQECYVCGSKNVFKLGFLQIPDGTLYYVCRSPCQFDERFHRKDGENLFQPLVTENQILPQLVNVPEPEEYTKIPISKTIEITEMALRIISSTRSRVGHAYGQAQTEYNSVQDYVRIMDSFVEIEHQEIQNQEQNRRYGTLSFQWLSPTVVTFKALPQLFKTIALGTSLKFSTHTTNETAIVEGITNSMHITARFPQESKLLNADDITVQVVVSEVPFRRQKAALHSILDRQPPLHWLLLELFLGNTEKLAKHNRLKHDNFAFHQPEAEGFPLLNEFQVTAVNIALSHRFTSIQGPPGTGKTTVIAAIAYSLVRNGVKPILVCAQSNVAADFATKRIAQTGLNVVRVLGSTREAIESDIKPFTTRQKAIDRFGAEFESLLQHPDDQETRWNIINKEHDIVVGSDVVCATCVSSGGARLKNVFFHTVIFDEAGQCLDPDLLIALTHNAQQMILVGDHKQLGPVVFSREAAQKRYNTPLLERLVLRNILPYTLRIQYRMHSAISAFPSSMFYRNLLINGLNDENDRSFKGKPNIESFPWPNPNCPILFWNVFASESTYESASSYTNQAEVVCIAKILSKMYHNGIQATDIGIITPYAGQQTFLIETLPYLLPDVEDKEFVDHIEISSVDSFQGREKNFIIVSCVRSNKSYDIGFMKDQKRLNVSLTRAKYGLIIVGNAATFAKNSCWCKLIESYKELNAFVEGETIEDFKPSTFTPLISQDEDDLDFDDNDDTDGIH